MGASGWSYFVPFRTDINTALQAVRQQVFEQGDYFKLSHDDWRGLTEAEMRERVSNSEPELREILLEEWRQIKNLSEPTTLENLLDWNRDAGTHSIIDMFRGVSAEPAFGTVSPLKDYELTTLFGAIEPTRLMVEDTLEAVTLYDLREVWQGLYIIVYENGIPVEICFAGFSGD